MYWLRHGISTPTGDQRARDLREALQAAYDER
ncbi:hypothetical protein ZBT109_2505 [Zymobacter palmae]|uniref:Uncharacterized protein n=1 Tax=Zymobacter palmae TaxID=33074 RepID=A0A348HHY3_9GAMM|nr:hypothetical protein ZBT109_2505 [Zymobacter palmae]